MVADAARVAHARRRDDDLRHGVAVDGHGFFLGLADVQAGELQRVPACLHQGQGFLVIALAEILAEDSGGLAGQRAVHVDREVSVAGHAALGLDLPQKIQQFLGAAHRKAGDDHVTALIKGRLQHIGQLAQVVRLGAMAAVAVGGLHNQVVSVAGVGGVLDERLVGVANIAGENDDLRLLARFGHAQRDGRTAQQVAYIGKAHLDFTRWSVKQVLPGLIGAGHELLHDLLGILDGIIGFDHLGTTAHGLTVFPLSLLLLDMGRVLQHNSTEVAGGVGGVNRAAVAVFVQVRDAARVVDVGVSQQQSFVGARGIGQVGVFVDVAALLHAAVDQDTMSCSFQLGTAARNLTVSA